MKIHNLATQLTARCGAPTLLTHPLCARLDGPLPSTPCIFVDLKEQALQLTTDPDHKFDLAVALNDVESALSIARSTPAPEDAAKWKIVGDRALAAWRFDLAKECFENAGDVSSLFLFHLATGDQTALRELAGTAGECFPVQSKWAIAKLATLSSDYFFSVPFHLGCTALALLDAGRCSLSAGKGQNNIALAALLQLGDPKACVDLLIKTDRIPEAALFARTYAPRQVSTSSVAFPLSATFPPPIFGHAPTAYRRINAVHFLPWPGVRAWHRPPPRRFPELL